MKRHRPLYLLALLTLGLSQRAAAQDRTREQPPWVTDVGVAGANVVAGALTAALTAAIRGNDVSEAFLKGAVGGGVIFWIELGFTVVE